MAVTLFASNTLSTTGSSTEDFLSSPNVAGVFVVHLDLSDMASGDVIEVRVYKMVRTGGTQRVLFYTMFSGAQPTDALIVVSEPVANTLTDANAVRFSVKQTAGTAGISIPWAVLNLEDFSASTGAVFLSSGTGTGQISLSSGTVSLTASQLFIKKNTALAAFTFMMTDSTNHNPAAGLTVTATRSIDGGAFAACANSVTGISSGFYKIDLANTDLNGTVIALRFTAAGADDRDLTIITQT